MTDPLAGTSGSQIRQNNHVQGIYNAVSPAQTVGAQIQDFIPPGNNHLLTERFGRGVKITQDMMKLMIDGYKNKYR